MDQGRKKPIIFGEVIGVLFNTIKLDFKLKTVVLSGSMSGLLLGGKASGINFNVDFVVYVVLEGRQLVLDKCQLVDAFRVKSSSQL